MRRAFRRCCNQEGGFTLIELLVVILIIGLLAEVAIPTFLGQTGKAHDAAAKSQARTAQTAAEVLGVENGGSFTSVTVSSVKAVEPTLSDTNGATLTGAAPDQSNKGFSVSSRSLDGTTFTIHRGADGTVSRTCVALVPDAPAGCIAGRW